MESCERRRSARVVNVFVFIGSFNLLIFLPLVFSYLACLRLFGFFV